MKRRGKCKECGNDDRFLVDSRICRACLWILRESNSSLEWKKEEGGFVAICDGCGFERPVKTAKNKRSGKTLNVCKPCREDRFFTKPGAYWRRIIKRN